MIVCLPSRKEKKKEKLRRSESSACLQLLHLEDGGAMGHRRSRAGWRGSGGGDGGGHGRRLVRRWRPAHGGADRPGRKPSRSGIRSVVTNCVKNWNASIKIEEHLSFSIWFFLPVKSRPRSFFLLRQMTRPATRAARRATRTPSVRFLLSAQRKHTH